MPRDEQEQIRRDKRNLCQAQYRGGDQPGFLNARCKKETGHGGYHQSWRRSQGRQATESEQFERVYMEWEQ